MTIEKLSEALDRLSERLAVQEMTLNVIKEAADRLEDKLSLVMKEHRIDISDEDIEKIKNWVIE